MSEPTGPQRPRSELLLRGFVLLSVLLLVVVGMLWRELDRGVVTTPAAAATPEPPAALALEPATFEQLPGWSDDSLAGFAAALERACSVLAAASVASPAAVAVSAAPSPAPVEKSEAVMASSADGRLRVAPEGWRSLCLRAPAARDAAALRRTLEAELRPWSMRDRGRDQGLVTGYYEPLLHGSARRTERFKVPLYVRPPELVDVDLGAFREELQGKRLAGVLRGNRLVPFADRAGVEQGALAGRGLELLWLDDPIDAFFLQIQGSGRVELEDGTEIRVGYAAQNGHPYVAIGRELVARGALALGDVTMQSIRAWLEAHPAEAADVMRSNPSFVFFRKLDASGPIGSQGVVLEPYRSIAVDTGFVPLGVPVWMAGTWPSPRAGEPDSPLRRLVIAQDTGGAIRGPLRADLFCGHGEEAAEIAGRLKHPFQGWVLLPRDARPQ